MNKLMDYMVKNLKDCHLDGNEVKSSIKFNQDFIGFDGHFPDKPIVPGICQIQTVVATVNEAFNKDYIVEEIKNAKFFEPILLRDEISCICLCKEQDDKLIVKANLKKGEDKVAQISLVLN
jgi:3-hydroxyacyl-[acyl-carrier-protein] dehydratase